MGHENLPDVLRGYIVNSMVLKRNSLAISIVKIPKACLSFGTRVLWRSMHDEKVKIDCSRGAG